MNLGIDPSVPGIARVPNFQEYSVFYDLLYRDKDYASEADYVAQLIRGWVPHARTILEFGSGTGRHGRLLAAMGFEVYGIERSPEMVSLAQKSSMPQNNGAAGSFTCQVGDICRANLGRSFDAVIALFHVMSYQTTNEAMLSAFRAAAGHLAPGGLFLFDVWHGPAVLSQRPSERVKEVVDQHHRVKRTARPELDTNRGTVKVIYQIEGEHLPSGEIVRFAEEHVMRYLFATEVDLLARSCGLRCVKTEEFLTGELPSPSTWGVTYALQSTNC
jgi:SAM-dependent methyltransferase